MRARLLLVVPATVGLVFAGVSPAAAHPHDGDGDLEAEVLDIKNHVRASDDGDKAKVRFEYRCEGDDEDIRTTVVLRQHGDTLSRTFTNKLHCDDESHWKTVTVKNGGDEVDNGRARVIVKLEEVDGGDVLDYLKERVWVSGVHDHDHDHGDHGHGGHGH